MGISPRELTHLDSFVKVILNNSGSRSWFSLVNKLLRLLNCVIESLFEIGREIVMQKVEICGQGARFKNAFPLPVLRGSRINLIVFYRLDLSSIRNTNSRSDVGWIGPDIKTVRITKGGRFVDCIMGLSHRS
jgi:hypothetical protein